MNQLVALVNEWDAFEQKHEGGSIADFCRYYLTNEKMADETQMVKGVKPPGEYALMMKTMGFIISAFSIYFRASMGKTKLPFPEAFYFLNSLHHMKQARKTDLINHTMAEYTTGMDAIGKLIKEGLISERQDETDKRAKLLQMTPKGEKILKDTYPFINKATQMVFSSMDSDSLKLCQSLLSPVEIKHSQLAIAVKHLDFEEMYEAVMNA